MKTAPKLPNTDIEFLKKLIPHREPIILIDTLQYYNENSLISKYHVVSHSIFTEKDCFSETGMIEHMAQSVALHTGYTAHNNKAETRKGYIGAIKNVEIIALPKLGDTIITQVHITYNAMDMSLVNITSKVNDTVVATAKMSTILKPASS